jgi:acylphosphatase
MATHERIVRVTIKGRVQGVGFRAWITANAQALGIAGWVRNRRNGTVEAVFAGSAEAIEEMCVDCHEGPPAARVSELEQQEGGPSDLGMIEGKFVQLTTA